MFSPAMFLQKFNLKNMIQPIYTKGFFIDGKIDPNSWGFKKKKRKEKRFKSPNLYDKSQ